VQPTGRVWLLAIALICAVGIVVAIELTRIYILTNTDPSYRSFCAVNASINCETVASSPYAVTFGVLNSVWALFAYAWLAGMAIWGMVVRGPQEWPRGLILVVSTALLGAGVALFYVMKVIIGALCVLCLALDVVNVALFVLALVLWRTAPGHPPVGRLIVDDVRWLMRRPLALVGMGVVSLAMLAGAVEYSSSTEERVARAASVAPEMVGPSMAPGGLGLGQGHQHSRSQPKAQCDSPDCPCQEYDSSEQHTVHMGRDEAGHQWIGAAEPRVVIEEFTDYECPFCRRAHLQLRALMARNPQGMRVVHRHYPLDHSCNSAIKGEFHLRACMLSRVAYCAGEQGRFWEMNDYLFQHAQTIRRDKLSAHELAERLELDLERFDCCVKAGDTDEHLQRDIADGIELGLRGTPAYVIDGQVRYGQLAPEVIAELLGESGTGAD
jgi:protein-disulfide isomerase/uncharacterized membrane protein